MRNDHETVSTMCLSSINENEKTRGSKILVLHVVRRRLLVHRADRPTQTRADFCESKRPARRIQPAHA